MEDQIKGQMTIDMFLDAPDDPTATGGWICSECGRVLKMREKYCPSCGVKMEVKADGKNSDSD